MARKVRMRRKPMAGKAGPKRTMSRHPGGMRQGLKAVRGRRGRGY